MLSNTQKLLISYVTVGVLAMISSSYLYYYSSKNAIIERTLDQLSSVKNLKKGWLEHYFNNQQREIEFFAELPTVRQTFLGLNEYYTKYSLHSQQYAKADSTLGILLEKFKLSHRYLNIWFVNAKYDVIYTVSANKYIGENLLSNQMMNPSFMEAIRAGMANTTLKDVKYISKDNLRPFIIFTTPIKDENNKVLGLILFKIDINEINNILKQRTGLGKTGESYVVNQEFIMRSYSRFLDEDEKIVVKTKASQAAFSGSNSRDIIKDYRNVDVLSSYVKIEVPGIDWALISEIDLEEAMLPIYELRNKMIWLNFFVLISIILITIYLSNYVSNMIQQNNRSKTAAIIEGQENERKRISRDLHDGIGQMLTTIKFKVQEIPEQTNTTLELKQLIDETTQEVRRLSVNLMPSVLYDFGLDGALKLLIKNSPIPIIYEYELHKQAKALSLDIRICCYRVIQESINNAIKHAACESIKIAISHERDRIEFRIKDNGKGFDSKLYRMSKREKNSNGIRNMKERVALLDGNIDIQSSIGKGTEIKVNFTL